MEVRWQGDQVSKERELDVNARREAVVRKALEQILGRSVQPAFDAEDKGGKDADVLGSGGLESVQIKIVRYTWDKPKPHRQRVRLVFEWHGGMGERDSWLTREIENPSRWFVLSWLRRNGANRFVEGRVWDGRELFAAYAEHVGYHEPPVGFKRPLGSLQTPKDTGWGDKKNVADFVDFSTLKRIGVPGSEFSVNGIVDADGELLILPPDEPEPSRGLFDAPESSATPTTAEQRKQCPECGKPVPESYARCAFYYCPDPHDAAAELNEWLEERGQPRP